MSIIVIFFFSVEHGEQMRLFGPLHPLVHFVRAIFQAEWVTTCLIVIDGKAQCLKIVKCLILSNCERNELCLFAK